MNAYEKAEMINGMISEFVSSSDVSILNKLNFLRTISSHIVLVTQRTLPEVSDKEKFRMRLLEETDGRISINEAADILYDEFIK